MGVLEAAEQLLAKLSRAEKAQVLQWTARDLGDAFPGIESRPGVCGGGSRALCARASQRGYCNKRANWAPPKLTCSAFIPRSGPRIWLTCGLTCGRTETRSRGRSRRTRPTDGPALFQRELFEAQAERIHKAIAAQAKLVGQLLRVNRGQGASGVVSP